MGEAPQKKAPEEGLLIVNSTQVPNVMLDVLMPVVAPALWKIICCVARQTYGWQKKWDAISLTQAVEKTGLSKRCVIDGFADLAKAGVLLLGEVGRYGQEYRLNTSCDMDKACEFLTPKERHPRRKTGGVQRKEGANGGSEQSSMGGEPSSLAGVNPDHRPYSELSSPGLVNQVPVGGEPRSPEVVNPDHPQNKLSKQTIKTNYQKGVTNPPANGDGFSAEEYGKSRDWQRIVHWWRELAPQPGTHVPDPEREMVERARAAITNGGCSKLRGQSLFREHFPDQPWVEEITRQLPLMGESA